MKIILFLAGLALAGYAGYQVEPSLRITLTGKKSAPTSLTPQDEPAAAPQIDFSSIPPGQLPEEVTLLTDVGFSDEATGLRMTLQSGAKAKLVRVVDDIVIIRIASTEYITSLPISQTDLAQRILNPSPTPQPTETPPDQPDSTAPPPSTPDETPAPPPQPAPGPDPSFPDPSFPGSEPTPAPQPTPEPEPQPTPEPAAPATPSQPTTAADVVAIMRQSLEKGEIKEFTATQVKSWKAEPQETLDGSTFDVGTVVYEQETIFGLKSITAKAYIHDGKVERWIWPKSGLTIQ